MSDPAAPESRWRRIAGGAETLVRSRLEIARILHAVAERQTPLTIHFPATDHLFVSQLRLVDADAGILVVDYGSDKAANADVLAVHSALVCTSGDGAGIEFIGADPTETSLDGAPAIRLAFPDVLVLQQRRLDRRIRTVPGVPLRCIADTRGAISFEAEIVDISVGGFGAIIYDEHICLDPGTVLHGCKIVHPGGTIVDVDIEIRHSAPTVLEDGTPAVRSGCRFIGASTQLEELMRVFVLDLEKAATPSASGRAR